MMEIGTALTDPKVLGPFFSGPSWDGWRAVLRAAFGERMTKSERAFFRTVADREPPRARVREVWAICGRRCGKDSCASGVITHLAASFEPAGRLRPGERALVACLAVDRAQAQTVLGYTRSYFEKVPALAAMVQRETADGFELSNNVDVCIATNDFRSLRGRTLLACIFDEVAYWHGENSVAPDKETYRALRPSMLTLSEAMLIGITTAYRRQGLAYDRWAKHFGHDGKVLVIRADSRTLNPLLPQEEIDDALAEDAEAAKADYLSEWRDDLSSYISRQLIESAVDVGVTVRPYDPQQRYTSFIDASDGMRDSFGCTITHQEGDIAIQDCLLEIPAPFSVTEATAQVAGVLKSYRLTSTMGDDHAKTWVAAELQRHGIGFEPRPKNMDRSALYLETLPLFSSGRVRLLDIPRLVTQYTQLERRLMPGGWSRIDHPNRSGYFDDLSNVTAGALWRISAAPQALDWARLCPPVVAASFAQKNAEYGMGERAYFQMLRGRRY
jgi:hypothetical protein